MRLVLAGFRSVELRFPCFEEKAPLRSLPGPRLFNSARALEEPAGEEWEVRVKAGDLLKAWRAFEAVKAEPRWLGSVEGRILCLRSEVYGVELLAWIAAAVE